MSDELNERTGLRWALRWMWANQHAYGPTVFNELCDLVFTPDEDPRYQDQP